MGGDRSSLAKPENQQKLKSSKEIYDELIKLGFSKTKAEFLSGEKQLKKEEKSVDLSKANKFLDFLMDEKNNKEKESIVSLGYNDLIALVAVSDNSENIIKTLNTITQGKQKTESKPIQTEEKKELISNFEDEKTLDQLLGVDLEDIKTQLEEQKTIEAKVDIYPHEQAEKKEEKKEEEEVVVLVQSPPKPSENPGRQKPLTLEESDSLSFDEKLILNLWEDKTRFVKLTKNLFIANNLSEIQKQIRTIKEFIDHKQKYMFDKSDSTTQENKKLELAAFDAMQNLQELFQVSSSGELFKTMWDIYLSNKENWVPCKKKKTTINISEDKKLGYYFISKHKIKKDEDDSFFEQSTFYSNAMGKVLLNVLPSDNKGTPILSLVEEKKGLFVTIDSKVIEQKGQNFFTKQCWKPAKNGLYTIPVSKVGRTQTRDTRYIIKGTKISINVDAKKITLSTQENDTNPTIIVSGKGKSFDYQINPQMMQRFLNPQESNFTMLDSEKQPDNSNFSELLKKMEPQEMIAMAMSGEKQSDGSLKLDGIPQMLLSEFKQIGSNPPISLLFVKDNEDIYVYPYQGSEGELGFQKIDSLTLSTNDEQISENNPVTVKLTLNQNSQTQNNYNFNFAINERKENEQENNPENQVQSENLATLRTIQGFIGEDHFTTPAETNKSETKGIFGFNIVTPKKSEPTISPVVPEGELTRTNDRETTELPTGDNQGIEQTPEQEEQEQHQTSSPYKQEKPAGKGLSWFSLILLVIGVALCIVAPFTGPFVAAIGLTSMCIGTGLNGLATLKSSDAHVLNQAIEKQTKKSKKEPNKEKKKKKKKEKEKAQIKKAKAIIEISEKRQSLIKSLKVRKSNETESLDNEEEKLLEELEGLEKLGETSSEKEKDSKKKKERQREKLLNKLAKKFSKQILEMKQQQQQQAFYIEQNNENTPPVVEGEQRTQHPIIEQPQNSTQERERTNG